jgi:hypothetical protein
MKGKVAGAMFIGLTFISEGIHQGWRTRVSVADQHRF